MGMGSGGHEAMYRSLFEDSRDALMLLDRDGYFDCNERALELFGVASVDACVQYAPWDLAPTTQPDGESSERTALAHIETAFEEGEAFFEFTHQRIDGTEFSAEVKLSRFEHEDGPALHALVRDITDRKAYERRLEEQRDSLDVLNQVLRHDVRNDLQLVTAYAELLAEECENEQELAYIETVLENADHAVELTRTAREMATVLLSTEDGLSGVSLRTVVERELSEVREAYPDAVVTGHAPIPATQVVADDMLDSVFRNLLKNAIQHSDKPVPGVTVSAEDRGDVVRVRVADNGPGVPDGRKAAVFGKGETGLESSGTGLGLYLVEALVDTYGGDVWIEDNDPTGAVFVVELAVAA